MKPLDDTLASDDVASAARRLLGCVLRRTIDSHVMTARIVETEAYDQSDAASHSFNGPTARNDVMFGPAGHLYVYFTYGMHYCCNIVTGPAGGGSAVLIRAVEPLAGEGFMSELRPVDGTDLTNGPAKLCQALGIDKSLNGHDLHDAPLELQERPALDPADITVSTRVGISQAKDVPRRFFVTGSPYVSKP